MLIDGRSALPLATNGTQEFVLNFIIVSQNIHDIPQVVHYKGNGVRDFCFVDVPTIDEHCIEASVEGTKDIRLQIVANHQSRFATGA